ncbi:MAG: hypothetical protein WCF85_10190 [Rhodospirillaceae bacterium]
MRRPFIAALCLALFMLIGGLPVEAGAQTRAAPPVAESSGYDLHPALAVLAGAVTGIVIASAVAGTLISANLLLEGVPLAEALESGTGLTLAAVGASGVLGGLIGHVLFNR